MVILGSIRARKLLGCSNKRSVTILSISVHDFSLKAVITWLFYSSLSNAGNLTPAMPSYKLSLKKPRRTQSWVFFGEFKNPATS